MPIITKSQLENIATARLRIINESRNSEITKAFTESRFGKLVTIFLSHSHRDKKEVEEAVIFLREIGISVYVDWMDDSMPTTTSGVTAKKIKEKIKENKKFILLATNNAVVSKWCNWELGLGDAEKYIDNIAIFPIADNSGSWLGNEYLQIYPIMERELRQGFSTIYDWYVTYPNRRKIKLKDWLYS